MKPEKIPDTSQAEKWLDPDTFIYKGKTYRVVMTPKGMIAVSLRYRKEGHKMTSRENAEIMKQGIGINSIIKDYTKMRDWELQILVNKGYEKAVTEKLRRTGCGVTGNTLAIEPK